MMLVDNFTVSFTCRNRIPPVMMFLASGFPVFFYTEIKSPQQGLLMYSSHLLIDPLPSWHCQPGIALSISIGGTI